MAITQQDIAAAAKVSRSTVAAILSESAVHRISDEVRLRVLAAAEQLGYRPNRFAQIMRNGKSGMIGVIDFEPLHQISQRKVLGVARAAIEAKYELIVQQAHWFIGQEKEVGDMICLQMLNMRVEGVVLVHSGAHFRQEHVERLQAAGIPLVSLGKLLKEVPCFVTDRERGYYELAKHLYQQGRRHLTALVTEDRATEQGVNRARAEAGAPAARFVRPPIPDLPRSEREVGQFLRGKAGMEEVLRAKKRPDAVICSNDDWALGAMTACFEAGVRVPEEIALTGFDNTPAAQFGTVPLTTVAQPVEAMAKQAMEVLLEAVRDGAMPTVGLVEIPGELVVRRSSLSA